ncbi:MAG: exodeoxyribonuclease III [Rhodospirillaceae bacterium]|jgi:exodeoxyribonuclease III|nr:exodeoxyribonuclease III [Rhodospirillaceae bacterium]MBT5666390.1 exodeoxyribonuclease III [Rhodospirillaceae bacterium]
MRLATWNINSIRLRIDLLKRLTEEQSPDVICLQETKVVDDLFPADAVKALGYLHIAFHGMKGYNGVAILSRQPLEAVESLQWCGKQDCRHLSAVLPGDIELHNFYVPAGGDTPDPEENDKFAHKLAFLDEMNAWFTANRSSSRKMVLVGDLNIAPLESDVWSHKQLLKVVSHTPIEVEKLTAIQTQSDWVDAVRQFIPEPERLYSWWSYRSRDWTKGDRGRRLDHVWVSPPLRDFLSGATVLRDARSWEKPSDHVPVIVDINTD